MGECKCLINGAKMVNKAKGWGSYCAFILRKREVRQHVEIGNLWQNSTPGDPHHGVDPICRP